MKLSLRQFLFLIGVFAILVPIIAILSYFVWKKPNMEREAKAFLRKTTIQNAKDFLSNFKNTCILLDENIKESSLNGFEKETRRVNLKNHITDFLELNKLSSNSYYWIVDLIDDDTSVMRVSNSELRVGSVLEMTESMYLHNNFLKLVSRAKHIKNQKYNIDRIRVFNIDPNVYSVYTFLPDYNWLIGLSFDMNNQKEEVSAYLKEYEKYYIYKVLFFSIALILIFSVGLFLFSRFISRDLGILQRVLEDLRRGNLREARHTFRMLSFDSKGTFLQMNVLEMDILQYINELYKTLKRSENITNKLAEVSKHFSELLFDCESSIKDQNLNLKQSSMQSDAIVLSANSLNVTAINSSRELFEFLKSSESANESLNNLKVSILNLSKASKESSSILEFIKALTDEIKGVVLDINKLSENANLVSFNIAIEAEKVGVEGLALALLSKEIHNVASDTKTLTEKIELSAIDLQDTLNADLQDMASFSLKMQDTNNSLSTLAGDLGEIVRGVDVLLRGFESLSSIISDQFAEANKLSSSISNLSLSGEQLGQNISNFKNENESIVESARDLKAKVSQFHF